MSSHPGFALPPACHSHRRMIFFASVDPELAERLAYIFYYWRARLRWPLRLVGVLCGLLLAWKVSPASPWSSTTEFWVSRTSFGISLTSNPLHVRVAQFPWQAYALVVVGCGTLVTWLHPNFTWSQIVPRAAVALASCLICFLCWLLPYTSVVILGIIVWGLVLYLSWRKLSHASHPEARDSRIHALPPCPKHACAYSHASIVQAFQVKSAL